MKYWWVIFFMAGCVSGENEKKEDDFEQRYWSQVLDGGRPEEFAFKTRDTALITAFIKAPQCFPIIDTTGVPLLGDMTKYVTPSGNEGWLLVVVEISPLSGKEIKNKRVEKVDRLWSHVIKPILIFKKKEKR